MSRMVALIENDLVIEEIPATFASPAPVNTVRPPTSEAGLLGQDVSAPTGIRCDGMIPDNRSM